MSAYYNEFDKGAAQWLRNLIKAGHIAPGYVDERSIEDVHPSDLHGFTQCHFFAGVGVWSYALRQSGFSDHRPVWTGSCPCQPFSAAGKGTGFNDERHLWPAFHHLIKECKPSIVFGEQVASKAVEPWIDLVHADLEALGYAFGCVPFPAAGVGAPHIRDRAYWVGDASSAGLAQRIIDSGVSCWTPAGNERQAIERTGIHSGGLADSNGDRCQSGCEGCPPMGHGEASWSDSSAGGLGNSDSNGAGWISSSIHRQEAGEGRRGCGDDVSASGATDRTGPVNGFWRAADWLGCRDGKFRPVEPGTFPLVNGATSRVVRLRAYGNAINAKAAQAFIESVMEVA